MELYFSDVFDVDPSLVEEYGAFNISLVNDLPLFIDPFLLFNSKNEEYQRLHGEIIRYMRFLRDRSAAVNLSAGLLGSWFVFTEVKQTWLGFSLVGNKGSGLGKGFAVALYQSLHTIFSNFGEEKVTRSSHLEKLCLIKDGVGKDNISDFTTNLIKGYLLEYTQKFSRENISENLCKVIAVPKVRFNYETNSWESEKFYLPFYNDDYVILTPKDILTKEDTWINKTDILRDYYDISYTIPNDQLRAQLNDYLIRNLSDKANAKERQEVIARMIGEYPEFIDYYIRYKEDHGDTATSLSEQRVQEIEELFHDNVVKLVDRILNESKFYNSPSSTYEETRARLNYLKDVIENKGGHRFFYDKNNIPMRREKDVQLLFRLTWFASRLEVSSEVNDGRGPVDFKISRGALDKLLVEFKLASNSQLRRNLENQVAIYEKASDAKRSLHAIVYFTDGELAKVQGILKELQLQDNPDVVLIDARSSNKPSGSKA